MTPKSVRNSLLFLLVLIASLVTASSGLAHKTAKRGHRRSGKCHQATRHHRRARCARAVHRHPGPHRAADLNGPPDVYWGAHIGTQFTGSLPPWDWRAVTDFEAKDTGGKAPSLMAFGMPFYSSGDCHGYCRFIPGLFRKVRSSGMIPIIDWQSTNDNGNESGYTDTQIASGSQDSYITAWARAAKAWGHPFFLRFDWEMNGSWFPWGVGANGNTAADFVAMWRHVHDIFTKVGATNVTWLWCPNVDPSHIMAPIPSVYPGGSYVDWTGLDAYNGDAPWTSFHDLINTSYHLISSIAAGKPMAIGETSSTEIGGSKATWITNMLDDMVGAFPAIHAFVWYEMPIKGTDGKSDWPIETSSSSIQAFSSGIKGSSFPSASYGHLNTSPIPAPS